MGAMGDWFGGGFWGDPNDPNGFGGFGAMMDGFGGDPEWTDTEYVYGPDYVDEHAFLVAPGGEAFYALVDANYNVVGWTCDTAEAGCEVEADSPGAGIVVSQYVYTPYGQPLAAEYPLDDGGGGGSAPGAAFPATVPGHQGLFFIRLGTQVPGGPGTGTVISPAAWDHAPLTSDALGVYYGRNRETFPHLGRFGQSEVNGTALSTISAPSALGEAIAPIAGAFNASLVFADGANRLVYERCAPTGHLDPLGLFTLIDLLGGGMGGSQADAESAAAAGTSLGYFSNVASALALRNQILGYITTTAVAMGARGGDFLARAGTLLNAAANKFTNRNYRQAFEELYGTIIVKWPIHHIFPKGGDLGKWFMARGINPNNPLFLKQLDPETHKWLHGAFGWVQRWKDFADSHKNATIDHIFQFAEKLVAEAGI